MALNVSTKLSHFGSCHYSDGLYQKKTINFKQTLKCRS